MIIVRLLKQYKLIFFFGFTLFSMNCRQPVIPTEEDLAGYGWTLYETGKYQEAREWFYDAVAKDSSYADGYNGIGWCFGKLRRADSAAVYFHISQTKPFDSYDTPDLDLDLYAGLTFAYSGMHIDSLVREYATYVLVERPILGPWKFSHDNKINHLDVRLELALADFNMGYFTSCRDNLQSIYNDSSYQSYPQNTVESLTMNVETLLGRAELAQLLQSLQQTLKNI
jgi:tetratricopeptide (TPR) repeat protein